MALWIRVLAALPENPHGSSQLYIILVPRDLTSYSSLSRLMHACGVGKYAYIKNKN